MLNWPGLSWTGLGLLAGGATGALYGAAFGFGIASGILPVILNAEIYVMGMGAFVPSSELFVAILCLGAGTVIGKAITFVLIRRGSTNPRFKRAMERRMPRNRVAKALRRGSDRMLAFLSHPYLGSATVLVSSLTSVPPLAVVTIPAAASRQPLWLFLVMVAIGRTTQFMGLAFLIHHVAR